LDAINIAGFLAQAMKKLGLEGDHWLDVLQAEWTKIVGEGVAKHTCPGRFDKKKLTVFVDSSTWLNELSRYGQKEMLANIQKRFGKEPRTKNQEPRTKNQEPRTKNQEPRTKNQEPRNVL